MKIEFSSPFDAERGAQLYELVGTAAFAPALLEEASTLTSVRELFGYLVLDEGEPDTIVSSSSIGNSDGRVAEYVRRHFRHDPAVEEFRQAKPGTSVFLRIPNNKILAPDYRRRCFEEPGFVEKLSFAWRGEGYLMVLSFYTSNESDVGAIVKLSSLVALVMPILIRHHRPHDAESAISVLERRLRRSYPMLSGREVEVTARSILGWTTLQIAGELGIGAGSVSTYRSRAYEKAGHSRAGEFVSKLLQ